MKLLVLTQNNCRYCEQVKLFLNNADVEYGTINVSNHPEYIEQYNVMGAPTVLLLDEDEVIAKTTGFNPGDLETMIEQM
jgi:thioredoxin 1